MFSNEKGLTSQQLNHYAYPALKIIYKCRENQFKYKVTRFCTDKEGNELSRITEQANYSGWFNSEVVKNGACDINATTIANIKEKTKICVTGFEPDCLEKVWEYPASKCSLRWD